MPSLSLHSKQHKPHQDILFRSLDPWSHHVRSHDRCHYPISMRNISIWIWYAYVVRIRYSVHTDIKRTAVETIAARPCEDTLRKQCGCLEATTASTASCLNHSKTKIRECVCERKKQREGLHSLLFNYAIVKYVQTATSSVLETNRHW